MINWSDEAYGLPEARKEAQSEVKREMTAKQKDKDEGSSFYHVLVPFAILCIVVWWVYVVGALLTGFWGNEKTVAFLTSPFYPKENFVLYPSPLEGIFFNFVVTSAIIISSILYYHRLAESKRVNPKLVFWGSVVASYVTSVFAWKIDGMPLTGTSIIGFTFVCFLVLLSFFDVFIYFNKIKNKPHLRLKYITFAGSVKLSVILGSCQLSVADS